MEYAIEVARALETVNSVLFPVLYIASLHPFVRNRPGFYHILMELHKDIWAGNWTGSNPQMQQGCLATVDFWIIFLIFNSFFG